MTLTEKQQEHKQWVEGLDIPPDQKQAALLLWDSLLAEVPTLIVPPAYKHDAEWEDCPNGLHHHWKTGSLLDRTGCFLDVDVLPNGTLYWCGWEGPQWVDLPSVDGDYLAVPVLPLPPEAVRVLRTYFSEESKCE